MIANFSAVHASRSVNTRNSQKLCIFTVARTIQLVSSTSIKSPTYTVATPFYVVIAALTTIILAVTGKPILQGVYVSVRTRSPNRDLLVAIAVVSTSLVFVLTSR